VEGTAGGSAGGAARAEGGVSTAAALAGLAGVCAVLAAWEAVVAAEQERLVRAAGRWLAPGLEILRSGREPTSPERRRLVLVGVLSLLGAGWLLLGLWAGMALGATAPWVARALLRMRSRRRQAAIDAGAPAVARALADALAGGHSVRGALAAAAAGGGVPGPAGEELRAAVATLELGERTDDVLRALARQAGTGSGLDTLVAAILLQRDAGGDLAGLLRSLAGTLEERARSLAEANSATAQARFTARLVSGLPVVGIALGELARPGLLIGLASQPLPALLVAAAIGLQVLGLLCVRRIARVGEAP
jgi:tight adherence protein B